MKKNNSKLKKEILKEVLNDLRKLIYVDPTTFQGLSDYEKTKLIDYINVEERSKTSNSSFIYTNHLMAPQFADKFIEFDNDTAELIKRIEWAYFDKIYPDKLEVSFNKKSGILKIGENELKLNSDEEPAKICALLFGSKQYIKRVRQWNDIEEKVLDVRKDRDQVNALKLKVFRLNQRIYNKFGYINLIIFECKTLSVNPDYYYLFK